MDKTQLQEASSLTALMHEFSGFGPLAFDDHAYATFAALAAPQWFDVMAAGIEREGTYHTVSADAAGALTFTTHAPEAATRSRDNAPKGLTAVIPVLGPITPFGVPKIYEILGIRIAALPNIVASARAASVDPDVGRIVLLTHSPGGAVSGVGEAAAALREVASRKKLVAQVNYVSASAAYWLNSAASEIIASPSAIVGSVGAKIVHMDESELLKRIGVTVTEIAKPPSKVDWSPFKPLSDTARAEIETLVGDAYRAFSTDIGNARGVDMSVMGDKFGRVSPATDALKMRLIDRIATFEQVLREGPLPDDLTATRRARLDILNRE